MFAIQQFFVWEMIRYINITKSTAIKYLLLFYSWYIMSNSLCIIFFRDTYLSIYRVKVNGVLKKNIVKKNGRTTFGNDFNSIERAYII